MNLKVYLYILFFIGAVGCKAQKATHNYESETLKIEQLSENTFVHTSYLETESFGNVPCNGMIVIDNGEALIFDTPVQNDDSKELLNWIKDTLKCKTKGIVVTHFHVDCLGGLDEFHTRKVPSYANTKTIELAKSDNVTAPQNGFDNLLELKVGDKKVVNEYLGEGHTKDNVVCYFPNNKALFGGCLIKEVGAGKGYLGHANVDEWSNTVTAVKAKYGKAEIIIPGHGKAGNQELLNYTIELFKKE
jgi:metallo-beta-lactamase class B